MIILPPAEPAGRLRTAYGMFDSFWEGQFAGMVFNGSTAAFQAKGPGSNPGARSKTAGVAQWNERLLAK